ncbi:MAG: hypothetical protein IT317_09525 [Anaerolineales bacterium]|nr:hypothetical protein [Anaerolineales bacterium]
MTPPLLKTPAPPQGIVAALVAGFETVNARLELILLPLLLDLLLWLGPHVSIQHLIPPITGTLRSLLAQTQPPDPTTTANVALLVTSLQDFGARFNVLSFLSTAPLGLPSLISGRQPATTPGGAPLIWHIDSVPQYLLLVGACALFGLFLGALYFGGIAQQVRDRRVRWRLLLRQVWGDWARLTALGALALFVIAVLGLPIFMFSWLIGLFSPVVGAVISVIGLSVLLWVLFYGGFALHGMLLNRRGLFGAVWDSIRLVQINLPPAAGLFMLVMLLNLGLTFVWNAPADNSWLLLLGLAGHALISTALITATFVFYQDRLRWWIEMRQSLQARADAERRGLNRKV